MVEKHCERVFEMIKNDQKRSRLRTKVRVLVLNAIAFKTEPNTVVRALKLVRGDSDIRGVVVKIVRVLKFVRIRILKIQKSGF